MRRVKRDVNPDISDNTLMSEISKGNKEAFAQLVQRHTRYAYTIAHRIVNVAEDAEEIVQDCFLKVARNPEKFGGDSKFSTWFYRVVSNASLSHIRKKKLPQESIGGEHHNIGTSASQLSLLSQEDQQRMIRLAMRCLKPEEIQLVTLYYLDELSQDEMMEVTQLDKGTIKVKLFRARKKLGEELSKLTNPQEMLM